MKHVVWLMALATMSPQHMMAQQTASEALPALHAKCNRQRAFAKAVPPGNYSGIAPLGGGRYAVVSDKGEGGYFIWRICIDSVKGRVRNVVSEGFLPTGHPNRDQEGVAYVPQTGMIYIAGETDGQVMEHTDSARRTGRRLHMPHIFATAAANYGIESLTYNANTHRFWTTTERQLPNPSLTRGGREGVSTAGDGHAAQRLRLQSFYDNLQCGPWHYYVTDPPTASRQSLAHAMGVSELCALDDGRLLVLEREFYVAKRKIGSFVRCKLYVVNPTGQPTGCLLSKTLLCQWKTRLNVTSRRIANYEGMCLGPTLADGSQTIILVSDSQNQYGGVLKDWVKTIRLTSIIH